MTARDVSSRLLLAVGLSATGCYDVPKPDCGFRCGPTTGCPDGYTCASDGRCHRDGSDPGTVCLTPDSMAGYSPRIVSSVPMAGDTVAPTATLFVTFDVNVAGVSTSSFGVFVRSTQTILPGTVSYDGGSKTATWSTPGGMPPNEQLNMVLSQDIFDPATTNALMELPIAFATGP